MATIVAVGTVGMLPSPVQATEITFRSATSGTNLATATLQLPVPIGVASGDVLLAGLSVRGKPTITAPTGWTHVITNRLGTTMSQAVYVHVAGASEPTSLIWTFSKAVSGTGGIVAYAGVDASAPVDAARGQTNASSATITAPSLTTTADGGLLVAFFGIARTSGIMPAEPLTERYEAVSPTLSYRISSAAADEHLVTAGLTGTRTASANGASASIGQLVALRAAVEATPDTTPPTVQGTSPAIAATAVPVTSNVAATFTEPVTGVDEESFVLTGPDSTPVPAGVSLSADTRAATLDPGGDLDPDTTYTASLTAAITDAAGNPLAPVTWSFQTAENSPPPLPPPPAIVFRSASSAFNEATTTLVLPMPSGVTEGDVLLGLISVRGAPTISAPAAWTPVISTQNGTILQDKVFVHTVGASEPSSYTFTFSKAAAASGGVLAYGGVDPTSPIDSAAGLVSGSSATITAPSITTSTPNAMLVGYFGIARITSLSQPAPMTERFESTGSSAVTYKISSAAAEESLGAPGPTGDRTAIAGGAAGNIGQLVALRAAGSSVVAAFDGLPLSGVAPLTVSFSDTSVGSPSAWNWDFGDGTPGSPERNPTHTFATPGAYTVRLTVTDGTRSDTEVKTDVVLVDPVPASSPSDPILVGAGDIADCSVTEDEATAALLDGLSGTVFTLGDNVYETGTVEEWMNCYEPTWGRHKARTRPALGDHDHTSGLPATEYFDYFGANAGDPSRGYYSYDLGTWHIIVLNSECTLAGGCGVGSPQETWLREDLAANASACTLAYWHEPLFTSVKTGTLRVKPFWDALQAGGAELVLNGDSHAYERFAPQTSTGQSVATGLREFIVGTGGRRHATFGTPVTNSEVRDSTSFGVLQLTLHASGYSWQFVPIPGDSLADSGSAACR